jgi:hypothetical protein
VKRTYSAADRKALVGHLKGAADLVAAVAKVTPMTWDDQVAAIIKLAAESGAKVDKDEAYARSVAESLAAKTAGDVSSLAAKVAKAAK